MPLAVPEDLHSHNNPKFFQIIAAQGNMALSVDSI